MELVGARFLCPRATQTILQHWRDRAAKMREFARTMTDTETAILMNDLAADSEKLAERAEILERWQTAAIKRQTSVRLSISDAVRLLAR